jgi:hypothetical protein
MRFYWTAELEESDFSSEPQAAPLTPEQLRARPIVNTVSELLRSQMPATEKFNKMMLIRSTLIEKFAADSAHLDSTIRRLQLITRDPESRECWRERGICSYCFRYDLFVLDRGLIIEISRDKAALGLFIEKIRKEALSSEIFYHLIDAKFYDPDLIAAIGDELINFKPGTLSDAIYFLGAAGSRAVSQWPKIMTLFDYDTEVPRLVSIDHDLARMALRNFLLAEPATTNQQLSSFLHHANPLQKKLILGAFDSSRVEILNQKTLEAVISDFKEDYPELRELSVKVASHLRIPSDSLYSAVIEAAGENESNIAVKAAALTCLIGWGAGESDVEIYSAVQDLLNEIQSRFKEYTEEQDALYEETPPEWWSEEQINDWKEELSVRIDRLAGNRNACEEIYLSFTLGLARRIGTEAAAEILYERYFSGELKLKDLPYCYNDEIFESLCFISNEEERDRFIEKVIRSEHFDDKCIDEIPKLTCNSRELALKLLSELNQVPL